AHTAIRKRPRPRPAASSRLHQRGDPAREKVMTANIGEPSGPQPGFKISPHIEALDRFRQVTVGRAITADGPAQQGQQTARENPVPEWAWPRRVKEFQDDQSAAGSYDPAQLGQARC